jgi:hypothetical protein
MVGDRQQAGYPAVKAACDALKKGEVDDYADL